MLLDRLPLPQPDMQRLATVLRRGKPHRVPLFELAIAEEVLAELNGGPLAPLPTNPSVADLRAWANSRVTLWHRLGYDYYRVRAEIPFTRNTNATGGSSTRAKSAQRIGATGGLSTSASSVQRQWADEGVGIIQTRDDFDSYAWPSPSSIGFAQAEAAITCLPEGMGAIGFSGGVLEWSTALMGLQGFMLALHDDADLVRSVVDRVGQTIHEALSVFCRVPEIFAIWLGDDMGFKTSTLISPEHLREYILPWHRKYAQLAHESGRFFILHSCGQIDPVMPDLLDTVGIDGKHSFEDVIVPIEQFKLRWGNRVAVLGGVDVDLLSRATPDDVRQRTRHILDTCAPTGGYACGSGNSITNYIPTANYLAMIETLHQFNGGM